LPSYHITPEPLSTVHAHVLSLLEPVVSVSPEQMAALYPACPLVVTSADSVTASE